jgi:cysteine desulfurase/selenocysteine lyase
MYFCRKQQLNMLDIHKIRADFPILDKTIYGKQLVYLDNAATTQKPRQVIDEVRAFYTTLNSNIHRGVHYLSNRATEEYENAREKIREFIHARDSKEIIFTKGTTESINLVACSFGDAFVKEGDEILVPLTEHHANIVPWQMLCKRNKAVLKVIQPNENGEISVQDVKQLFNEKTKLLAIAHVVNSTGVINPIKDLIDEAHKNRTYVLIDGAQAVQHKSVNVTDLDCDFYAFSGHKMFAETGIGILYGKKEVLEKMPPYQYGGDMIKTVTMEESVFEELPLKFEAGTANYVGAFSTAKSIDYLNEIGLENIEEHEKELLNYATEKLENIEGLKIYGKSENKISAISFLLEGIHQYDTGMLLDKMGIAVRTGTHCAQPSMQYFGIEGTVRASFALYNTIEEIDLLYDGLLKVKQMFS